MLSDHETSVSLAQQIGGAFVHQYYTVLNSTPNNIFRFYGQDSCYIHGGNEKYGHERPPAIGTEAIRKTIAALGFSQSKAQILLCDAQPSINGSVVVQVIGDFSTNGSKYKRFMQTFVLVPQTPKKYYVHNDIFRYLNQDTEAQLDTQTTTPPQTMPGRDESGSEPEDDAGFVGSEPETDHRTAPPPLPAAPSPLVRVDPPPSYHQSLYSTPDELQQQPQQTEQQLRQQLELRRQQEADQHRIEQQQLLQQQQQLLQQQHEQLRNQEEQTSQQRPGYNRPASYCLPPNKTSESGLPQRDSSRPTSVSDQLVPHSSTAAPGRAAEEARSQRRSECDQPESDQYNRQQEQQYRHQLPEDHVVPHERPEPPKPSSYAAAAIVSSQRCASPADAFSTSSHRRTPSPRFDGTGGFRRLSPAGFAPDRSVAPSRPTNAEAYPEDYPESQQLFIGNLPECSFADVALMFKDYGALLAFKWKEPPVGKPCGFGFAALSSRDAVERVLATGQLYLTQEHYLASGHRVHPQPKRGGPRGGAMGPRGGRGFPRGGGRGGGFGGRGAYYGDGGPPHDGPPKGFYQEGGQRGGRRDDFGRAARGGAAFADSRY